MKRPPPAIEAENCVHCPAFVPDKGVALCASGVSVIPSRLAAQVTDGVWNAVVTTLGKGTFLIRCPKDRPVLACPLRAYEVRHIAPKPLPLRRNRPGNSADHRDRKEACRDLRMRVGAGQNAPQARDMKAEENG